MTGNVFRIFFFYNMKTKNLCSFYTMDILLKKTYFYLIIYLEESNSRRRNNVFMNIGIHILHINE